MRRLFDYRSVPRAQQARILAAMLFGSVLSYLLIVRFVLGVGEVEGNSMVPTLQDGDRYVVSRLTYRFRDPRPGDLVEIRMKKSDDNVVKRIIALPGDVVHIRDGDVYVNGTAQTEAYLPPGTETGGKALGGNIFKVSDDAYFVLGDNRAASVDSRIFGAVKRDALVGRLWLRLGFSR